MTDPRAHLVAPAPATGGPPQKLSASSPAAMVFVPRDEAFYLLTARELRAIDEEAAVWSELQEKLCKAGQAAAADPANEAKKGELLQAKQALTRKLKPLVETVDQKRLTEVVILGRTTKTMSYIARESHEEGDAPKKSWRRVSLDELRDPEAASAARMAGQQRTDFEKEQARKLEQKYGVRRGQRYLDRKAEKAEQRRAAAAERKAVRDQEVEEQRRQEDARGRSVRSPVTEGEKASKGPTAAQKQLDEKKKIDLKKVGKAIWKREYALKAEYKKSDVITTGLKGFDDWVARVNDKFAANPNSDQKDVKFETSHSAQLMRYLYAASAGVVYDPLKGTARIKLETKAAMALAEGEFRYSRYAPSSEGEELGFLTGDGVVHLGLFRGSFAATAQAFAGVNVALSGNIGFDGIGNKNAIGLVGIDKQIPDDETKSLPNGALCEAGAFAGLQIGIGATVAFEWKSRLTDDSWATLVKLEYGLTGALGLGLEGEFTVYYAAGKFGVRVHAKVIFGGGIGGKLAGSVDAKNVVLLFKLLWQELSRVDFRYIPWIAAEAFDAWRAATTFMYVAAAELAFEGLGSIVRQAYHAAESYVLASSRSNEVATRVARNLARDSRGIVYAPPETKASLLDILTNVTALSSFNTATAMGLNEEREEAIVTILKTIRTRREYRKVLEHMAGASAEKARERIEDILDGLDRLRYDRWLETLPDTKLHVFEYLQRHPEKSTCWPG